MLDVIKNFEAIMCFLGVIEVFFSLHRLISCNSQHCYLYHQFDLVYYL